MSTEPEDGDGDSESIDAQDIQGGPPAMDVSAIQAQLSTLVEGVVGKPLPVDVPLMQVLTQSHTRM